jgi:hypothetical protein
MRSASRRSAIFCSRSLSFRRIAARSASLAQAASSLAERGAFVEQLDLRRHEACVLQDLERQAQRLGVASQPASSAAACRSPGYRQLAGSHRLAQVAGDLLVLGRHAASFGSARDDDDVRLDLRIDRAAAVALRDRFCTDVGRFAEPGRVARLDLAAQRRALAVRQGHMACRRSLAALGDGRDLRRAGEAAAGDVAPRSSPCRGNRAACAP